MDRRLPLPTLLSHALVAFTIEFDNEFEHRMPHRTTNHGTTGRPREAPWLVSMAMWTNCMRFVAADGVSVRDLRRSAWWLTAKGTETMLRRMGSWWGYLTVRAPGGDGAPGSGRGGLVVRPTRAGRRALQVWAPLAGTIEARWRERFGDVAIAGLQSALGAVRDQLDTVLPDCLPAFEHDLARAPAGNMDGREGPLYALLSQVLLALTLEYEQESAVPLAVAANVLRVLGTEPTAVRELPARSGLAREAVDGQLRELVRRGDATVGTAAGGRSRVAALTAKGRRDQQAHARRLALVEQGWTQCFGTSASAALRGALAELVGEPRWPASPLCRDLLRYPDGWRAAVRSPDTLPYHPVISHRGGFPDGS